MVCFNLNKICGEGKKNAPLTRRRRCSLSWFRFAATVKFIMGAITRRIVARSKGALTRLCWGDSFSPLPSSVQTYIRRGDGAHLLVGCDWEHREAFLASQRLSLMRRESDLLAWRSGPPPAIAWHRQQQQRPEDEERERETEEICTTQPETGPLWASTPPTSRGARGSLCFAAEQAFVHREAGSGKPDWIAKWKRKGRMSGTGVQLPSTVCA